MNISELSKDTPEIPGPKSKPQRGAIQVYEALRDDILWLRISPGSAIDEVALATRFDISRTPIREALMLLAGDGLVVFLPNRTSIVPPLSLENMGEFMDMYLLLSRAVIHGVIQHHKPDQKGVLHAGLADVLYNLGTSPGEPALRADLALRHVLGNIADNAFQNRFYRQILDMGIRVKILHFFPNSTAADLAAMRSSWQALIEAITGRDAEAADQIITRMILAENEVILRSLQPRFGHDLALSPQIATKER
jgi:DNA-binding GntR family transcriptional regulator